MNERKRATIRTKFIVEYSNALARVRKSQKGLRTQFTFSIMLLGEYKDGLTCSQAAELSGKQRTDIFMRFSRAISKGYIYKSYKVYFLTDSGKCVYNSICKEFDQSMNEILAVLMDEVRRKM